ncbi:hypothetical protein ALQ88_200114 [Pseudomonas savastanoi]|nr:hypothetical protein ALQ88_200114 [Pseudomonas savastanoi]
MSAAVTGHHGGDVVQGRKQVDGEQVGAAITGLNEAVAAEDVGEGAVFIDFAVVVVITAFEVAAGAAGKADQAVSLVAFQTAFSLRREAFLVHNRYMFSEVLVGETFKIIVLVGLSGSIGNSAPFLFYIVGSHASPI